MNIGITGTGSYLPTEVVDNGDFNDHCFLNPDGTPFPTSNEVIIKKFKGITGIGSRRYAEEHLNASDLAFFAAEKAIADAGIDKETLDHIILAHNFGDMALGTYRGDTLPSLASKVKHRLGIRNPKCVAYDILFGCPGWIQAMIQAHTFIRCGMGHKCLVIGAETLSRVTDPSDRDSMIYADGAGAVILERGASGSILGHSSATYAHEEAYYLTLGKAYDINAKDHKEVGYIKMNGRKIYEFALTHVPRAMKECLDASGVSIGEVKKIMIHQANEKMDEAIVQRFYQLYGLNMPQGAMPMNIGQLGNSSVATIPTLLDMVRNGKIENQSVAKGDVVIFASVGAGMNINAIVYRI